MVRINSGAPEPTDKFNDTPRDRWDLLLIAKRHFLSRRLVHDCRCLIEFCEEAETVYSELGFKSAIEMIREGYELEPSQVELAVAWLKANGTEKPVPLSAAIAEAREKPLLDVGPPTKEEKGNPNNVRINKFGNDTDYTLRRLARDAPEMLDRIEAGELSVNAAAIQAGIRKKPTPEEICIKAFGKAQDKLKTLKAIIDTLEPYEAATVRDWVLERLH